MQKEIEDWQGDRLAIQQTSNSNEGCGVCSVCMWEEVMPGAGSLHILSHPGPRERQLLRMTRNRNLLCSQQQLYLLQLAKLK